MVQSCNLALFIPLYEPPRSGIIPSRPVKIQPDRAFQPLPGKVIRRGCGAMGIPFRPPRVIAYLGAFWAATVGGYGLAAQMISQQVIQCAAARSHGYADASSTIVSIFNVHVAGWGFPLEVIPNRCCCGRANRPFNPGHLHVFCAVAIAIICEAGVRWLDCLIYWRILSSYGASFIIIADTGPLKCLLKIKENAILGSFCPL